MKHKADFDDSAFFVQHLGRYPRKYCSDRNSPIIMHILLSALTLDTYHVNIRGIFFVRVAVG